MLRGVDVFLLKDGNADTLLGAILGQVDNLAATSLHDALSG